MIESKKIEPAAEVTNEMVTTCLRVWFDTATGTDEGDMRAALSAALAVAPTDSSTWVSLGEDDPLNVGDEVKRELEGFAVTAVVARIGETGSLWAKGNQFIGIRDVGTWYVRRTVQELPTTPRTVIVPADGHEYIEAVVSGAVWRTREAVLGLDGRWHGAWRVGSGRLAVESTGSDSITPGTWKAEEK
ncbi:hypothetical protein M3D01_004100 [Micrococcus luteus]|nr:hypothetical protein [Micrococcus luteus]